jgi:membrane-associated protein
MWRGSWRFLLPYRSGRLHGRAFARSCSSARQKFNPTIQNEDQLRVLDAILHLFHSLYNPEGLKELIRSGGAPLICAMVFVETGFFVGFFLPGDSLLVTAGIFSAAGVIPLKWLLLPVMLCAIVGDQIGYWIGRSAGAALYRREDSLFFRRSHLQRARDFYEKYGGRAVILARFIPIVRTFCPPVAGAAKMPYSRYLVFDIFGGVFWVGAMILGGYSLGRSVPNIGQRIHYVIAAVIVLSMLPAVISILRARHKLKVLNERRSASISRADGE